MAKSIWMICLIGEMNKAMRLLLILWLSIIGLATPTYAATATQAVHQKEAAKFVGVLADEIIRILSTTQSRAAREAAFDKLLTQHANIRAIARFTLGKATRKTTPEDFARFQVLMHQLLVKVYANRLGTYTDEKLIIGNTRNRKNNFIVASRIEFPNNRPPLLVDWWVIREKDGRYTLRDLRVLGIWMAQEQRETFAAVLDNNRGDIKVLLHHLQAQINRSNK